MGPKVEAAIAFLEQSRRSDARVIICALQQVADALAGRAGTHLKRD
jgi:carbamate kinase